VSKWSNATYDKLYTASLEELDSAKRAKIFHQMEKLAFDEMPVAPIYHYTNKYLIRPEVKNWTDNMFNIFPLREVRLEP
jgi:oligopeptide transport system substrate-binding protein